MNDNDVVRIPNVLAIDDTRLAVQVKVAGRLHWIPQSQIHDDSEVWKKYDRGTLVISEWIAEAKGIL